MIGALRRSARTIWIFTATAFEADARLTLISLGVMAVGLASGAFGPLGLRALVNGVSRHDLRLGLVGALGWFGGVGVQQTVTPIETFLRATLRERTLLVLDKRLALLTSKIPTTEHFERPDYLREVEQLSMNHGALVDVEAAFFLNVHFLIRLALVFWLYTTVHLALALLPLCALPALISTLRTRRRYQQLQDEFAESYRMDSYLQGLATSAEAGKEIRIFGLAQEIVRRYKTVRQSMDQREDRHALLMAVTDTVGWLLFAAGLAGAIVFVAARVGRGESTLGDAVLVLTLTGSLLSVVAHIIQVGAWLMFTLKAGARYAWLVDYSAQAARAKVANPAALPVRLTRGIGLEGLTFWYPGTEQRVLDGVTVLLPAGSIVAIVGENGAGKTTLVKLLSRFYDPSSGHIGIDGADLRGFDPDQWRTRLSAGFQDFARFELLARETVGVGDLDQLDDLAAVSAGLDRACAADVVDGLPARFETQLGRSFDGGVELSGGQWQKLSLGRAMMRSAPLLMILDEPTAAIDAQTEHALFERYADAGRRVGQTNGGITLLVSHRFSTVSMADLILVMNGGRIVEQGTHGDLMSLGHIYAELYRLQARAYA